VTNRSARARNKPSGTGVLAIICGLIVLAFAVFTGSHYWFRPTPPPKSREEKLKDLAASNDVAALIELGNGTRYDDPGRAASYYRKAIALSSTEATYQLGSLCAWGVQNHRWQELGEGEDLLLKAAATGHTGAHYTLGFVHEFGLAKGRQADLEEAAKWYKIARSSSRQAEEAYARVRDARIREISRTASSVFNHADAEASVTIGAIYLDGADLVNAQLWFEKGAKEAHPSAQAYLGLVLERTKGEGNPEAIGLYKMAAASQHPIALKRLGSLHWYGTNVAQDTKLAFEYTSLSASTGDMDALCKLGFMYYCGGLETDVQKAVRCWEEASTHGHIQSLLFLAQRAEYGTGAMHGAGATKSIDKAIDYYRRAAELGDSEGKSKLARLVGR
jgi:TPR repeat protein